MKDSHFEFMTSVCEVFGRFALHNAFIIAIEQGTAVGFSMQGEHLLEWTTNQVLPALTQKSTGAPLQELDLSRISFLNESMVSMGADNDVLGEPQTPDGLTSPLAPPRKKGNRNATPERLDGAFGDISQKNARRKDSKIIPGDSTVLIVRALASNLLRTACNVCVDWLGATGGAGSSEILKAALKWCSIFDSEGTPDDKENPKHSRSERQRVQMDLLPALTRLSIDLGKTAGELELFKQLLFHSVSICDEMQDEWDEIEEKISAYIQSTVATLLRSNATEATVDAVLTVVYKTIERLKKGKDDIAGDEISVEMPASMVEVLFGDDDCTGGSLVIAAALQAIASHKKASALLAEKMVANFDVHSQPHASVTEEGDKEATSEDLTVLLFESRCLWLISDSGACRDTPRMKNVLQKLDALDRSNDAVFGDEKPIQKMIQEILREAGLW